MYFTKRFCVVQLSVFTQIWGCCSQSQHAIIQSSCLHAAGIHAEAGDINIVQANALLAIAVGGANIRVHQSDLAEARQVLIAYRRGDFALGDDFDPNQGEGLAAPDGSLPSDSV